MSTSKIAAIYARVSTDEQAETNNSLPSQVRRCLQYAQANGFTVPDELIFCEDYTGMRFNRPEMDKLLNLVRRGGFDAVIVFSSDRLTREPRHGEDFRNLFRKYGVELHYTTRGKIEDTPEAEMFSGIEGQFDKYWRHKVLEGMSRGRWEKAESGKWVGNSRPPYGYDKVGVAKDATLVINEHRAEIIRSIFRWIGYDKLSIAEVARRLTELHEPTPGDIDCSTHKKRAYAEWGSDNVYHVLRNETYRGYSINRRRTTQTDELGNTRRVLRDKSQWIRTPVPVIIEEELWQAAHEQIGNKRKGGMYGGLNPDRLLARLLKCKCGYAISSSKRKGKRGKKWFFYYMCTSYISVQGNCRLPSFPVALVDDAAWQFMVELLTNPQRLILAQQEQQQRSEAEGAELRERISAISENIERNQRRLDKLLRLIANAEDAEEESVWTQEKQTVKEILRGARAELELLEGQLLGGVPTVETVQTLLETGQKYGDLLRDPELPMEFKRGIFDDLKITGMLAVEEEQKVLYLYYFGKEKRLTLSMSNDLNSQGQVRQ